MSVSNKPSYSIRLSLENGKVVDAQLEQIGSNGEKSLQKLSRAGDAVNKSFAGIKNQIAGELLKYLGPSGLVYLAERAAKAVLDLDQTAKTLKMPVEELQAWHYAAIATNASTDDMTQALTNFSARLGAAQAGMGALLPIMKAYHIQFAGLTNAQVMNNYITAIKNARTQQDALFLSQKAFGDTEGEKLLTLFRQGTEGLEKYGAEAQHLGLILDKDMVAKIAETEQQMKGLLYITQKYAEYGIGELIQWLDDLANEIDKDKDIIVEWLSNMRNIGDGIAAQLNNGNIQAAFDQLAKNYDNIMKKQAQFEARPFVQGMLSGALTGGAAVGAPNAINPQASGNNTEDRLKALQRAEAIKKQIADLKFRNEQLQKSAELAEVYNELQKNNVDINSDAGQQIKKQVELHQQLIDKQSKQNELAGIFGDTLLSSVSTAKGLAGQIEQVLLKYELIQPLEQMLKTSSSSGGGFSLSSIFGFADGGIMSKNGPLPVNYYSGGGIASGPQLAVFGEGRDDEAFVPLPNGRSIPVEMRGGGAAQSVVVNQQVKVVNNAAQDGYAARAVKSPNGVDMDILIERSTNSSLANGSFDRTMTARYGIKPKAGA
ncbi:MAG: hypothetical protein GC153_13115 [Alphaproteobacteria bacterium]|nr:hypothetical protein [Alphaproteobacteria bacterium]